jgi:hypothetical protein
MRISDHERERAVEELRRHCAAGRIDVDDYAARVEEALCAETLADLDRAFRDLPRVRIPDPELKPPLFAPHDTGRRYGPWTARIVLAASVAVIALAVSFALVAQWVWAVVLVAGWLAGIAQGRIPLRRRG